MKSHVAIYARVSSDSQDFAAQMPDLESRAQAFRDAGREVRIYTDKFTGREMTRPGWDELWNNAYSFMTGILLLLLFYAGSMRTGRRLDVERIGFYPAVMRSHFKCLSKYPPVALSNATLRRPVGFAWVRLPLTWAVPLPSASNCRSATVSRATSCNRQPVPMKNAKIA